MKIEPDDFEIWLASPVTHAVMDALRIMENEAREKWMALSWVDGVADQNTLIDLRATARICGDLAELTLEELEAKLATSEA